MRSSTRWLANANRGRGHFQRLKAQINGCLIHYQGEDSLARPLVI